MVALVACNGTEGGAYARVVTDTRDLVGGPAASGEIGDVVLGNDLIRVIISRRRPSRGLLPVTGAIIDAATLRAGATEQGGADALDGILPLLMTAGFDAPTELSVTVEANGSDGNPAVVLVRAEPVNLLRLFEVLDVDIVPTAGLRLETEYILAPETRHVVVRSRLVNGTGAAITLDGSGLRRQLDAVGSTGPQPSLLLGDALLVGRRSRLFVPTVVPSGEGSRAVGYDVAAGDSAARERAPPLPALPGMLANFIAATSDGVSYGWAVAPNRNNAVRAERPLYAATGLPVPSDPAMVVTLAVPGGASVHHTVVPVELAADESFEVERYFIVGTGDVASLRAELARIRGTATGVLLGEIRGDPGDVPIEGAELHILDGDFRPFSVAQTDPQGRFRAVLPEGSYFLRAVAPGSPPTSVSDSVQSGVEIRAGQSAYRRVALTAPAGVVVRAFDASGRPMPAKVSVVGTYDPSGRSEPAELLVSDLSLEPRRATDGSERRPIGTRTNQYVEAVGRGLETASVTVRPNDCAGVDACTVGARGGAYRVVVSRGPEFSLAEIEDVVLQPGEVRSFSVSLSRVVDTQGYLAVDFDIKSAASPGGVWSPAGRALAAASEGLEAYFTGDANRVSAAFTEAGKAGVQDWVRGFDGVELTTVEQGEQLLLPVLWNSGRDNGLPDANGCTVGAGVDTAGRVDSDIECTVAQIVNQSRAIGSVIEPLTVVLASHPRRGLSGTFNSLSVGGSAISTIPLPLNDIYRGWPLAPDYRNTVFEPTLAELGNYEGIVVWHGKEDNNQLRDFRAAREADLSPAVANDVLLELRDFQCGDGHPNNALGGVIFREGGEIRFPGALSDFDRFVGVGRPAVAVAASGSGGPWAEPGGPRSYVWVGEDDERGIIDRRPQAVTEVDVLNGLFQGRVILSNGPFLDIRVRTPNADGDGFVLWPVGSFVRFGSAPAPDVGTAVSVLIRLRTPPWIRMDTVTIRLNGQVAEVLPVPVEPTSSGTDIDDEWLFPVEITLFEDSFLTVDAEGSESLFPVITPLEEPRSGLDVAVNAVARAYGLPEPYPLGDGLTVPRAITEALPYATTNPILFDVDATGAFAPPGIPVLPPPAPTVPCPFD